jgi:hypothetical protein
MLAAKSSTSRFSHETSTGALWWPTPGFWSDIVIWVVVDLSEVVRKMMAKVRGSSRAGGRES